MFIVQNSNWDLGWQISLSVSFALKTSYANIWFNTSAMARFYSRVYPVLYVASRFRHIECPDLFHWFKDIAKIGDSYKWYKDVPKLIKVDEKLVNLHNKNHELLIVHPLWLNYVLVWWNFCFDFKLTFLFFAKHAKASDGFLFRKSNKRFHLR